MILAEFDASMAIGAMSYSEAVASRQNLLATDGEYRAPYLEMVAENEATSLLLGSPHYYPIVSGISANLYVNFLVRHWNLGGVRSVSGLVHQDGHLTNPAAADLRRRCYSTLRRHFHFVNGLKLFEEVKDRRTFSINIYGVAEASPRFMQLAYLVHPSTVDSSLAHRGGGMLPGYRTPGDEWDLRGHRDRVCEINDNRLSEFEGLVATHSDDVPIPLPILRQELDAVAKIARVHPKFGECGFTFGTGWPETDLVRDGVIARSSGFRTLDDVVLSGPNFDNALAWSMQPRANYRHHQDYDPVDLETVADLRFDGVYSRSATGDVFLGRQDHVAGEPVSTRFRAISREMLDPSTERTLRTAVVPPGPYFLNTVVSVSHENPRQTLLWAGISSSLLLDFVVKILGLKHLRSNFVEALPVIDGPLAEPLILRILRLNCISSDYKPLWDSVFQGEWMSDSWTMGVPSHLSPLGAVGRTWTSTTPLRRELERRLALLEVDVLSASMLGITVGEMSAIYRSQFSVLRKHEYSMAFDAEGRRICKHHHAAGYRQSQLQEQAKNGERGKHWKSVWSMFLQYEEDPDSVDWEDQYTAPFTRVDREAEMTRAYNEFQRRLAER